MIFTVIDCYTDEPSGLGVPPYLGTYPRYIAGQVISLGVKFYYLRIDDLRYAFSPKGKEIGHKTNIYIKNRTKNAENTDKILKESDIIIVIAGIHTPGKYLSAMPGSINEVIKYIKSFNSKKILTGPAAYATLQSGGRILGGGYQANLRQSFDIIVPGDLWSILQSIILGKPADYSQYGSYDQLRDIAIRGSEILDQIDLPIMIELESARGCLRNPGCSFCMEPLKGKPGFRKAKDIIDEAKALKKHGAEHFRIGKQSDFYAIPDIRVLLQGLDALHLKTLHIDNVDPVSVLSDKGKKTTELIAKYCTAGNVAAFGAESFDENVIKANNLNSSPLQTFEAIRIINKAGGFIGKNGSMQFLPGINIILGLMGETKETLEKNLQYLTKIRDEGLLLRRINIRQVDIFPGTPIYSHGLKTLKKNKRHYFSFIRKVREEVDFELLKKTFPKGSVLKDVFMEIHDGNHTFGRQFGSYPIIIGTETRQELNKFYDIKIIKHMLRSITGEIIQKDYQSTARNP